MPGRSKTISELKKELKIKQRQIAKLRIRRRALASRLAAIDKKINALTGGTAGAGAKKKKAGRKKARKATRGKKKPAARPRKAARARKRATGTPLAEYVVKVLGSAKKGLRVKEVVSGVRKAGYKSLSKDFYGIVATALRDKKFKRLARGVYALAR